MKSTSLLFLALLLSTPLAPGDTPAEEAAAYSRTVLLPLVKSPGKDKNLFKKFKMEEDSPWNPNCWAASLGFDQFTGIGWGTDRAGVLVTPEHVLSAAHYGNNSVEGMHFYDKDGNYLGHRALAIGENKLVLLLNLPNDVRVGRLESPAPAGAKIYALPDPNTADLRASWGTLPPDQLPLLLATDWRDPVPKKNPADPKEAQSWKSTRSVHPVRLRSATANSLSWTYGPNGEPAVDPSYHGIVNLGDSSHPLFWVTKSGLVLASTFSTTSSGPNYGSPEVQKAIQDAIGKLGGSRKYTLKTAPVP